MIDEKMICKEYKKMLGDYYGKFYNPLEDYFNSCGWSVIMSDRSRGKTTNVLLLALLLQKYYGIIPHYIRRQEQTDLAPLRVRDLFKTIQELGYIEKLTDGKYNSIEYKSRRWYYMHIDEEGNRELAPEPCLMCMGIDCADNYKSTYNTNGKGGFIIFDEFIPLKQSKYLPNEFVLLLDLIKTIFRDRTDDCKIFLLSNVISKYSPYFKEFGCQKEIQKMKAGDSIVHETIIGTKVYFSMLGENLSKSRQKSNSKFFGFENPELKMLNSSQWQMKLYKHPMFRVSETELLNDRIFLLHNENLVQLELRYSQEVGKFVVVHPCNKEVFDNSTQAICYTLTNQDSWQYRFGFGKYNFDKKLWRLFDENKFYYSENDMGALVEDYVYQTRRKNL